MSEETISLSQWWFNKRLQYNKGLLFTALLGYLALTIDYTLSADEHPDDLITLMQISGVALLVFLLLANIAYGAGFVIDYFFNNENSQSFRDRLFLTGYIFAVLALVFCIVLFLIIISIK